MASLMLGSLKAQDCRWMPERGCVKRRRWYAVLSEGPGLVDRSTAGQSSDPVRGYPQYIVVVWPSAEVDSGPDRLGQIVVATCLALEAVRPQLLVVVSLVVLVLHGRSQKAAVMTFVFLGWCPQYGAGPIGFR